MIRFFRSSGVRGSGFPPPSRDPSTAPSGCNSTSIWLSTAMTDVASPATKPLNSTFVDFSPLVVLPSLIDAYPELSTLVYTRGSRGPKPVRIS